jgi:hypothetical protein
MVLGDVGVPLGRGDRSMAQELLHDSYVRTIAQEQSSYRVPKHMRSNMPLYPCIFAKLCNDVCDSLGREAFTRSI